MLSRSLRSGVRLTALALASTLMATASQAADRDSWLPSPHLSVAFTGEVESGCSLSGGGSLDLRQLTGGDVASAPFGLACNVPFDIIVASRHGGLAHESIPEGQGPYAGTLGYDVNLTIPTRSPQPAVVTATFDSAVLVATQTVSSGEGISAGDGLIEFRTHLIPGAGLLAGEYRETLTLSIAARY